MTLFKRILPVVALLGVIITIPASADAARHMIALSPMQSPAALEQQSQKVIAYALEQVQPGETLQLFNALDSTLVGTFIVPDKSAYRHPKAKLHVNKRFVLALRQFKDNPQAISAHGTEGLIHLPRFLGFLGSNYGPFDEETRLLLIGSPLYMNGINDDGSMKQMRWYKDGAFNVPLQQSPLSLAGRENTVPVSVHWLIDDSLGQDDAYKQAVKRMWTLYMEGHGATLNSFDADAPTVWNRFKQDAKAPAHGYTRNTETAKAEIEQIIPEPTHETVSIYERELSKVAPSSPTLRHARNVEIGIRWDCVSCDLDLYVQPHRSAETLSFRNRESALGFYHKDFRHSPDTENGHETVTMTVPVDLHDMRIGIHFFSGTVATSGVTGEIRLAIDGQTYGMPFTIPASSGHVSAGTFENSLPQRINIDPLSIVGL
ncbi:MAG: hypothetical protein F6K62_10850 [Sphaerospermopsis sp. SIO1G2]|nr:hypothetical protein [Sphaerospermopsis sp. SIO1G2]